MPPLNEMSWEDFVAATGLFTLLMAGPMANPAEAASAPTWLGGDASPGLLALTSSTTACTLDGVTNFCGTLITNASTANVEEITGGSCSNTGTGSYTLDLFVQSGTNYFVVEQGLVVTTGSQVAILPSVLGLAVDPTGNPHLDLPPSGSLVIGTTGTVSSGQVNCVVQGHTV